MSDTSYSNELFNVLIERSERLTSLVLKYVPNDKPITILDLGCGTGDQALALADALPQARIIGLDISRPNIDLAEQKRREHHACDRIHFMETDYMHFVHEPFDVIFSWGVLHLIPVPTAKLCAKLARDLKPNGLFLNTMPYDCKFNRTLSVVRRMLRAIQSPWTDSVLLRLASWVHRGQFDKTLLQQRILYMYESPRRMDSRNLRQEYVHHGISVIAEHAQPHVSVAQMKQHFACFIKQAA